MMEKNQVHLFPWFVRVGIGRLAFYLLLGGIAVYYSAIWRYRLVLRDEVLLFNLPAPILIVSLLLVGLIVWAFKRLALRNGQRIGWAICEGRRRGGPTQWEEVLLCSVPGGFLLGIGLALFVNCACDTGPVRVSQTTVMHTEHGGEVIGYDRLSLTDWKRPGPGMVLTVASTPAKPFGTCQQVEIKTKAGLLGYEWVVDIIIPGGLGWEGEGS